MSDVIQKYFCNVIFEKKNEVGVLPRWAFCPTLPYQCKKQYTKIYTICEQYDTNPVNIIDADRLAPYGIDNVIHSSEFWVHMI